MCGIAGFLGTGTRDDLQAMTRRLVHRGPDGEGYFTDDDRAIFFGHRRLSILDRAGGDQPMWDGDRTVCVIFNGEIYNHHDLRRELEAAGHRFHSDHSDTEVLVHGYKQWDTDLPSKLNGMFAFAIYDTVRGRVVLGRDRFGKKPLYYAVRGGTVVFASELTALLQHPGVAADFDPAALRKYFAHGFFPAPHTPYQNVHKLPGGHTLTVDLASRDVVRRQYWRFVLEPDEALARMPEQDLADQVRETLSRAVRRRLEADVPLGFLLSGGIDSSAVVRLASDHVDAHQMKTFAIAFDDPSFDESGPARRVADLLHTDHREELCHLDEARQLIPDILGRMDEPLGDSSLLPTYQVCRFARRHVTVALGGDGGDEMFAGYDPFRALALARIYQRLVPKGLHRFIGALVGTLPVSDRNMSLDFKLKRTLRGLDYGPSLWNPVWMAPLAPADIADLYGEPIDPEDLYSEALAEWRRNDGLDLVDQTLAFFTNFYLQDGILVKADRASMLESLELRSPFLDSELADLARRIPHRLKLRNGETKYILKKALESVLPKDVLYRRKKGFGVPLARWLREMPPTGDAQPVDGLDSAWFEARWQRHRERREDWRQALWCWMTLRYLAPPPAP